MTTFKLFSFKRLVLTFAVLLTLNCVLAAQKAASSDDPNNPMITARARAIHDSAIVVDTHADTPQRFLDENFDIGNTDPKDIGHISLNKVRSGNLGARDCFAFFVPRPDQRATKYELMICCVP